MLEISPGTPSPFFRVLSVTVLLAACACSAHRPATSVGGVEPALRVRLATADPARRFVVMVDLTEKADLREVVRKLGRGESPRSARRHAVIAALERVASRQQARMAPLVDRLLAEGALTYVRPVIIVNRLIVEGTATGLLELAKSPEVARIVPEWTSEHGQGAAATPTPSTVPVDWGDSFRSWALDAMKVDRLWARGLDGSGVVVATIDTGANEAHEQLHGHRLDGDRGWFDPVEDSSIAVDHHGHGTGVLSQAVGINPSGRIVGVAPGARWCAALGNWKNHYSRVRMTLAADWVLRFCRPDVLINAWSHDEGECNDFDRAFIDAWKASGIFVIFPAGNGGPREASGESPAQLTGVFPDGGAVFSVAALGRAGEIDPISSRGPSRCGSTAFPTLAAPGAELPMAGPSGSREYARGEGTSLAAGLLGGAAALLLQAVPELDPEALEKILVSSAIDVPPPGRDDASGAGAVDLERALALARGATPP